MGILKVLVLFALVSVKLASSQNISLTIYTIFDSHQDEQNYNLNDTNQIAPIIKDKLDELYYKGFLLPKTIIHKEDSLTYRIQINCGIKYRFINIENGNILKNTFKYARINKLKNNAVTPSSIAQCNERIVTWYENNGFPFAQSNFIINKIMGDSISGQFIVTEGPKIMYDSIIQKGNYKIEGAFFQFYLGIKKDETYCERRINKISQRINNLRFIELTEPPSIIFSDNKANVVLLLKRKKANRFDGIIGFAPNPINPDRIAITGDVSIGIMNSFNHGESIDLKWRSLGNGTQDLKTALQYPYILGLPFGVNATLSIYKKDSSYISTKRQIGIDFLFSSESSLSGYFELGSSSIISNSLQEIGGEIAQWANMSTSLYGINLKITQFDYLLNPRRGWMVNFNLASGTKKILSDSEDDSLFNNDVDLNTYFSRIIWNSVFHIPLAQHSTIKLQYAGGAIQNLALFKNELLLTGGLNSIRGFDEYSISASQFSYATVEYRYLFERNAYLCLFTDIGQSVNATEESGAEHNYWSFGTGISFETKAGIFSLAYAIGRDWQNSFDFRNSKIHFGLAAQF